MQSQDEDGRTLEGSGVASAANPIMNGQRVSLVSRWHEPYDACLSGTTAIASGTKILVANVLVKTVAR